MSGREAGDDYDRVVAVLNDNWRVIECRDRIQWILQCRGSPNRSRQDDWRGRSYCRTSEALLRCVRRHAGRVNASAMDRLARLSDRVDRWAQPDDFEQSSHFVGAIFVADEG